MGNCLARVLDLPHAMLLVTAVQEDDVVTQPLILCFYRNVSVLLILHPFAVLECYTGPIIT